jgi:hypothetical protein
MEFLDSRGPFGLNMLSGQKWLPFATWARGINWRPWKADKADAQPGHAVIEI